ncbi:sodium-coupled monocarboxylate transporter 2-like [Copidosoma floridanum]|uniref:sodium-coupled monocarboxylate transporter 2-like n=1 Tax=Copidosoma floridanum TaxID=29053 RepID=UPI0006C9764E|nr:sodium-coupled monocarboxylate transporter 2-like [Copidosoma floridanum]
MEQLVFSWIDYLLFSSLLGTSLLIGIYFGFFSKQDSVSEYLFGGKSMGYLPVATSILASLLSGITFLGVPTEVYLYGCQYFLTVFNTIATGALTAYVFIPVFYNLQISSTYEYLELRFSRATRRFASVLYVISLSMHLPIVIYVPALAFSQATGYNLHLITPLLCIVCITYTSMGGVKAVVWTDTIQFIFTVGGLSTVLAVGVYSVGGFFNVWKISGQGGRLDIFDFNPSPFVRNNFWSMTIGTTFSSLSHSAVGQKFIQRYLAIKSLADINKAVLFKTVGTVIIDVMCTYAGLVIYTQYYNCDPISAKLISRNDQIVPYYVMDITKNLPGIAGVFLAGIISSALSTMSAGINTLSGIIYDDFIEQRMPECPEKDARAANIMKVISVFVGLISIALIFAIEHMGTVLEMSYSFRGAADGPLLGFFLLGMFFPCVGKKGAMTGACVGLSFMLWVVVGAKWHMLYNPKSPDTKLPMSTANCSVVANETIFEKTVLPTSKAYEEPMILFRISFLYFCLVGTVITVAVGVAVSYIVGESNSTKVDPDHLTPIMRR